MHDSEFPVWKDVVLSGITTFLLVLLFSYIAPFSIGESELGVFISLLGVIIGVLFTVITILYAFEDTLKENIIFKELKAAGKYNLIYPVFSDSIAVVFYSIVGCLLAFLIRKNIPPFLNYSFSFAVLLLVIVALVRTYRCFTVYVLLQKVTKKHQKS